MIKTSQRGWVGMYHTHKRDEKYIHTLKLQDMTLKTYTQRGQLVWQRVE